MDLVTVIALMLALLMLVYLAATLLYPEKF
jgi:hypothetical protein